MQFDTEPEPGVFNFTPGDALFAIAERTGKRMRGHTLGAPGLLAPTSGSNVCFARQRGTRSSRRG